MATIWVDSSEKRPGTVVPAELLEMCKVSPNLEKLSGADFLITTLRKPPRTMALIKEHARNGALFVQRKSGHDLLASVADRRLFHSLFKMTGTTARIPQRILLTTGIFAPHYTDDGRVVTAVGFVTPEKGTWADVAWTVNDHVSWDRFQTTVSKNVDRGFRHAQLPINDLLTQWFKMKVRHLDEYAEKNVKTLYAMPDYPDQLDDTPGALQMMQVVQDWRIALAAVPNFGPDRCESVKAFCDPAYVWPMLSDPTNVKGALPKGIGVKSIQAFREFFGIPDDFCYQLVPIQGAGKWKLCSIHNILFVGDADDCPMCDQDRKKQWTDPLAETLNEIRAGVAPLPGDGSELVEVDDGAPPWTDGDEKESENDGDTQQA